MDAKPFNVLFLCTGNSARSIIAEALMNKEGKDRFQAYSAGSMPTGKVNPHVRPIVESCGFQLSDFRSKAWDEFAAPGAPPLDFIFTVCDNAAGEVCPYWPGQPATAHWGYPDPSAGEGSDAQKLEAFRQTLHALKRRLEILVSLPTEKLEKTLLQGTARELASR